MLASFLGVLPILTPPLCALTFIMSESMLNVKGHNVSLSLFWSCLMFTCMFTYLDQIGTFCCFFFLRQGLTMQPKLSSNLLYRPDWSWIHDSPALASWVLGLQACATMPGIDWNFLKSWTYLSHSCA
jgi:hypothetical protein